MKEKMPVLFIGHGSPINAIEDNQFSRGWKEIAKKLPKPKAILVVSAHWYVEGTKINDLENPKQIYDMYGFPQELYNLKYPVKGSESLSSRLKKLLRPFLLIDNKWGIDHGAWSILVHMFPNTDVPVMQLSIDYNASLKEHYELGKKLSILRDEGILIIGSGNIVHNLALVNWSSNGGFDWAVSFDKYIKENILDKNHNNVIDYQNAGDSSKLAFYTLEHYIPLLYVLGASNEFDKIEVFNEECTLGSISMTSYLFK